MKNQPEDVGATAFDYSNNQYPYPTRVIYYGNQLVPHPTNTAAKSTSPDACMRAVLEGK